MRRSTALGLAAIVVAGILIRLSPLLTALYWGSDFGEYFTILRSLAASGRMPTAYLGWGSTYPYFPGMFFVQESAAGLGGLGLLIVLNLAVPILGALAVVPIFLIGAEVTGDDRVALFVAAFIAGAMPHVYSTSHTAPSTLGDLLAFTALLLFLRAGRDSRRLACAVVVTAALIPTHHLSTYFLIIMVLGTIVLRGLLRPLDAGPGLRREVAYAGILLVGTFAFWFGYATPFRENILVDVNVQPWWLVLVAFAVLLVLVAGLVLARRRLSWRYRPAYPNVRRASRMFAAAVAFVFGFSGFTILGAIPGTGISLPASVLLYFAPFLILISLSASGRKFFDFLAEGVGVSAWFLALAFSTLVGSVFAPRVLIPYRHVEYLIVPLAIFAGFGFFRLLDLGLGRGPRRTAAIIACGALLVASFAVAIPPRNFVAGWDEATRPPVLDGAYWARDHVDGLLAADHRASTAAFGFGGVNSTWDTTVSPFFASDFNGARPGLVTVPAPSGVQDVGYVWIDQDQIAGVELRVWEPAMPMPPAAVAKFDASPFVKVFDNGFARVYWIAWGCDGAC
jgi:hypothetical protein